MSTRAVQFETLLAGIRHPVTGASLAGGKVEFYAAGTVSQKTAWTDEEKTNPIYQTVLDAAGRAQVYGDGVYKVKIYDASNVLHYTWDNIKVQYYNSTIRSVIVSGSVTVDDDVVLVDTTAGNITLNLPPAAQWSHPIVVKKTSSDANTITLDPSGSELIDGATTLTFSVPGYAFTVVSTGSALYGATPNPSYLSPSGGAAARMNSGAALEFGDANQSIRNANDSLYIRASAENAVTAGVNAFIGANTETPGGGVWNRLDTAIPSYLMGATRVYGPIVYTAPAGANPIAWNGPYPILHTGNTANHPVVMSGNCGEAYSVAAGATQTVSTICIKVPNNQKIVLRKFRGASPHPDAAYTVSVADGSATYQSAAGGVSIDDTPDLILYTNTFGYDLTPSVSISVKNTAGVSRTLAPYGGFSAILAIE